MGIIDVHAHYGNWPFPGQDASMEKFIQILDKYQIKKTIISSAKAIFYDFREGNEDLNEFLKKDSRFYGYIVINPNYQKESINEIVKYARPGSKFIGVKLHPDYCRVPVNSKKTLDILEAVQHLSLPLLVHSWSTPYSNPKYIIETSTAMPQLKIIMAHMGGPVWKQGIEAATKASGNIYLEISSGLGDKGQVMEAVKAVGAQRVLFGTDTTLFDPGWALGKVEAAELNKQERQMILYQNAMDLFKF
jgi:predicted TIM-barrel fold metal-dependent hydrolase